MIHRLYEAQAQEGMVFFRLRYLDLEIGFEVTETEGKKQILSLCLSLSGYVCVCIYSNPFPFGNMTLFDVICVILVFNLRVYCQRNAVLNLQKTFDNFPWQRGKKRPKEKFP